MLERDNLSYSMAQVLVLQKFGIGLDMTVILLTGRKISLTHSLTHTHPSLTSITLSHSLQSLTYFNHSHLLQSLTHFNHSLTSIFLSGLISSSVLASTLAKCYSLWIKFLKEVLKRSSFGLKGITQCINLFSMVMGYNL